MKPWLSLSLRYGRRRGATFASILGLMILDIGFNVLMPWPLKLIVDNVLPGQPLPDAVSWVNFLPGAASAGALLTWLALATLLLFIGRQSVLMIKGYLQAGASSRIKLDIAGDLFLHLQKLSLGFHDSHKVGDLVRRVVKDTDFVKSLITGVLLSALTSVVTLLAMFWVMWKIDPLLSLVALLAALPMPAMMRWLTPRMSERAYEQYQAEGALMAVASSRASSMPAP